MGNRLRSFQELHSAEINIDRKPYKGREQGCKSPNYYTIPSSRFYDTPVFMRTCATFEPPDVVVGVLIAPIERSRKFPRKGLRTRRLEHRCTSHKTLNCHPSAKSLRTKTMGFVLIRIWDET